MNYSQSERGLTKRSNTSEETSKENRGSLQISNLKNDHTDEELFWMVKEVNKFLQTDSPAKAIFGIDPGFGMKMFRRHPNTVDATVVYSQEDV